MYAHTEKGEGCIVGYDVDGQPTSDSVYGTALLLMGLFHIIEWFRTILLLTVTCMKYEIVMYIYNILFLNLIFGFVTAIYAHVARFGSLGSECAASQPKRAQFLLAEVIFFYILYIIVFLFIAAFPKVAYELAMSSW